jgi:hypothetical protein
MVVFQTQKLRWYSWIMVEGHMRGIHLFCIHFLDSLPIYYTALKQATYLKVVFGNAKYHQ